MLLLLMNIVVDACIEKARERESVCVRLSSKAPMNSGGATWPRGVRHPSCPGEEERERERDRERERESEHNYIKLSLSLEAGYSIPEILDAGFCAQQMRYTSLSADGMRDAGFGAKELWEAGYSFGTQVITNIMSLGSFLFLYDKGGPGFLKSWVMGSKRMLKGCTHIFTYIYIYTHIHTTRKQLPLQALARGLLIFLDRTMLINSKPEIPRLDCPSVSSETRNGRRATAEGSSSFSSQRKS